MAGRGVGQTELDILDRKLYKKKSFCQNVPIDDSLSEGVNHPKYDNVTVIKAKPFVLKQKYLSRIYIDFLGSSIL